MTLNLMFSALFVVTKIYIATINVTQFCGAGKYKCDNSGVSIGVDQICDGTVDCPDNEEDEWTCTEEPTKCLRPKKVCDVIKDCDNNEDEEEYCKHSKLKCYKIYSKKNTQGLIIILNIIVWPVQSIFHFLVKA